MYIVLLIIVLMLVFLGAMITVFKRIMDKQVTQATRHLDELGHDYELKEKKIYKELEDAKTKAREIITSAQNEAEKQKTDIIKQAQLAGEQLIQETRQKGEEMINQAEKTRHQLLSELEERISKDALHKACEIIQDALPEELRRPAHSQWVNDLIKNGFSQIERLHIPADLHEIKIVSAFKLGPEERHALLDKLKSALQRDVTLREEVDPKLVAGLAICIGSLVLDGSLKNRIQEKVRS